MKELKVLSIDFDYFQQVSAETLVRDYPDGHDFDTDLSTFIWATHYATPETEKRLKAVKIDKKHFNEMIDIINSQNPFTPNMIVNSHIHIYDFIIEHMKGYNKCSIVNIDMHHDMFNDNKNLDCGNWVSHIKKAIPDCNITWIANTVSDEVFGLKNLPVKYDFETIKDKEFDIIFLCRSDIWTAPHLDKYFDELVNVMRSHFIASTLDEQILKPRDMDEYIQVRKQIDAEYRRMRKQGIIN